MSFLTIAIIIIIIMVLGFIGIRYFLLSAPPEPNPIVFPEEPATPEKPANPGEPPTPQEPAIPIECPDGFTAIGNYCYATCPEGTSPYDRDPTKCRGVCPSGFHQVDNYCQADSPIADLYCNGDGQIMINGACYNTCPIGDEQIDMKCYKECPDGFNKDSLFCSNIQTYPAEQPNCPNNYSKYQSQCQENCSGNDYEMINSQCYHKCPVGFTPYITSAGQYTCMSPYYNREDTYLPAGSSMKDCEAIYGVGGCDQVAVGRAFPKCNTGYGQSTDNNNKATCYQNCPSGFSRFSHDLCMRPTKILSYKPLGCYYDINTRQSNGLCYPATCPTPYKLDPLNPDICYLPCPEGFISEGNRCLRPSIDMDLLGIAQCPSGYELISGSCYANCPIDFTRLDSDLKYCVPYEMARAKV